MLPEAAESNWCRSMSLPPRRFGGRHRGDSCGPGNGESHRVLGTVYADGLPRVLRVDGYAMDMIPEGPMVLLVNKDQPGVIGLVGTSFGDASVNIADMVISRHFAGGTATAMMMIKTDSQPPKRCWRSCASSPYRAREVRDPARPRLTCRVGTAHRGRRRGGQGFQCL